MEIISVNFIFKFLYECECGKIYQSFLLWDNNIDVILSEAGLI